MCVRLSKSVDVDSHVKIRTMLGNKTRSAFLFQNKPQVNAYVKLSKRLQQIEELILPHYEHVWDCCCDHGFLGASLLKKHAQLNVHFVDIVPDLMTQLHDRLMHFFGDDTHRWHTHCLDVAKLPLDRFSGRHLVIIAGVGGDLMMEFIEALETRYKDMPFDYLLCPVHHQYALRQALIQKGFSLHEERLVEENHRFYEMLLVSNQREHGEEIHPIGKHIWQAQSPEQRASIKRYLEKTRQHYSRIAQGQNQQGMDTLAAYQAIELK